MAEVPSRVLKFFLQSYNIKVKLIILCDDFMVLVFQWFLILTLRA